MVQRLLLALDGFLADTISRQQRRSHVLATLSGYWRDISTSLERRLCYQSIMFPGCWALDLRATVLPEQRFHFPSCSIKPFVVSSLYWNLNIQRNRMPSAFFMRPLSSFNTRSWSLELLQLLRHPRPLPAWRWKVWETRANHNDVVCLYHGCLLPSRHPSSRWPRTSHPQMYFLINILFFYLGFALSSMSYRRCIFDISILSLAVGQRGHAHLLLFELYLIIISVSFG